VADPSNVGCHSRRCAGVGDAIQEVDLLLALLLACKTDPVADTDDTDVADTDPVEDTDTDPSEDTDPLADADADGATEDVDCDDADGTRFPGAYDLPNDGLDQDCDGSDRVFGGILVDASGMATATFEVALPVPPSMDVAFVIDTSCAATDHVQVSMDVPARDAALDVPDVHWGVASFEDYAVSPYGAPSYDLPFHLELPVDPDAVVADSAVFVGVRAGADPTEAGLEALYQALTGTGHDLDCDGVYDSATDVVPFAPSAADPFGGTAPAAWSGATVGTLGGMGFRDGAVPVLVYITDNWMRDADSMAEVPGGCPSDAGMTAVIAAANAMDAWLVAGFSWDLPTGAIAQMETLANATGSLGDLDGDGVAEPLIVDMDPSTVGWQAELDRALAAVVAGSGMSGIVGDFAATVTDNAGGFGVTLTPDSLTDVNAWATPAVTVEVEVTATPAATVQTGTITVEVTLDGAVIATETFDVEVVPL
jgi:hypothetical protein